MVRGAYPNFMVIMHIIFCSYSLALVFQLCLQQPDNISLLVEILFLIGEAREISLPAFASKQGWSCSDKDLLPISLQGQLHPCFDAL
jgi:hypothetical protein